MRKAPPSSADTSGAPMHSGDNVEEGAQTKGPQGVGQIYDAPTGTFDPVAHAEADEELYWLEENERKIQRAEAVAKHVKDRDGGGEN